jgi:hypothetical protein
MTHSPEWGQRLVLPVPSPLCGSLTLSCREGQEEGVTIIQVHPAETQALPGTILTSLTIWCPSTAFNFFLHPQEE